jgi:uncharacterized protein YndB with AHSA1/START domain
MEMIQSSRSHETRVVINAPIEAVWKAITDPDEMARWFAPKMTVQPSAGGVIVADWGPGLEWKTDIEVWEENRHLRLAETRSKVLTASPVEEPLEPCRLVEDFYLSSEGGKTVLRLVHSGFGSSEAWDSEYDGTRGGWAVCFFRLKLGLERHRNDTVVNRTVTALCEGIACAAAMRRIEEAPAQPWTFAGRGPFYVCATLPGDNDSLVSISVQPSGLGCVAYVELLLFGVSPARAAAIEAQWRERLSELFPARLPAPEASVKEA